MRPRVAHGTTPYTLPQLAAGAFLVGGVRSPTGDIDTTGNEIEATRTVLPLTVLV